MGFVSFPIKNFGWILTLMLILHHGNVQVNGSQNDDGELDVQVQSEQGKLCYCRILYLMSILLIFASKSDNLDELLFILFRCS